MYVPAKAAILIYKTFNYHCTPSQELTRKCNLAHINRGRYSYSMLVIYISLMSKQSNTIHSTSRYSNHKHTNQPFYK